MQAVSGMQAMPASMARMQAKAAQLAAELELARDCSNKPGSPRASSTDCPSSSTTARVMAPAPRRMSQVNATNPKSTNSDAAAQTALMQCQKLEAQVQMWKGQHFECERELQRHQDSYMRREEQLQARLAELEQRLNQATPQEDTDSAAADADAAVDEPDSSRLVSEQHRSSNRRGPFKAQPLTLEIVQHQMQRGVEDLLHHQRLQLRAEEAAQLRQFRGRLAEVEAQLAADKRAAAADQDSWMSKTLAVREELARTQEVAVKLDAMYRLAEDEAAQLRVQFKAQEDDRQHLIRQVLGLKRQNHHLQQQATALQEELDAIMSLEVEEGQRQEERGVQLHLHQQLLQQGGSRPHSAVLGQVRARPMTAGPAGGGSQKQEGTACWRPLSGLTHAQEGRTAGAGDTAAAPVSMLQQQDNSRHTIQQLQKALACERRQLRQLRSAYTAELGRRNELQTLLLDSIQQAKRHHADAAAAYAARRQADAAAGEPWQQQQRPQSGAGGPRANSGSSSPNRQLQGKAQARPASAAPACGSSSRQRQAWGTADSAAAAGAASGEDGVRPNTACAAGAASAGRDSGGSGGESCAGEGVLSQQAWCQLLNDLLSRQQLLELLLQRACPELVAAAQQLHQGQQGAALVSPLHSHSQQQGQQQGQREQQHQGEHELLPHQQIQQFVQQRWSGEQRLEQQDGGVDSCPDDDMFMIAEDDGVSQGSGGGSDDDASDQPAGQSDSRPAQLQQQPAAEEGHQQQAPEQHLGQQEQQQQQGGDVLQQDEQPLQVQRQPQHPPSLSPQRKRSAGAVAAPWQQQSVAAGAAAAGGVPLGSMSVPMMGSFPVRKLLHSSSAHSSSHASHSSSSSNSSFHKGRQRRPESAAAAAAAGGCLRGRVSIGDEMSFALRPMSAVSIGSSTASAGQVLSKSQHSSAGHQAARHGQAQQQQHQAAGAVGSRQQQQQLSAQHAGQSDGLSIRSWGGQDSKGAQQMLKSFLAGQ